MIGVVIALAIVAVLTVVLTRMAKRRARGAKEWQIVVVLGLIFGLMVGIIGVTVYVLELRVYDQCATSVKGRDGVRYVVSVINGRLEAHGLVEDADVIQRAIDDPNMGIPARSLSECHHP